MDKTAEQAEMLKNRVAKNHKLLRKWARKNSVTCFRLYDRDIPEIPLSIDLYEFLPDIVTPAEAQEFVASQAAAESENQPGAASRRLERTWLKVFLYERPYEKPEEEERAWLDAMTKALADCLGIDKGRIAAKTRAHEKGGSQYAQDHKASQGQELPALQGLLATPKILRKPKKRGAAYWKTALYFLSIWKATWTPASLWTCERPAR